MSKKKSENEEKNTKRGAGRSAPRKDMFLLFPEDIYIEEDPNKPYYDATVMEPIEDDFVDDIRANGIIQPVGIVSGAPNANTLDFGRKRVLSARRANVLNEKAGLPRMRVPCVFGRRDERTSFKMMVSENVFRRAAYAPTQMLSLIAKAEQVYGMPDDEILQQFRLKPGTLRAYRALAQTSPTVQKAVEAGKVNVSVAVELAKLPVKEQGAALQKLIESGAKPTVRAAKAARTGKKEPSGPSKKELLAFASAVLDWEEGDDSDDTNFIQVLEHQHSKTLKHAHLESFACGVLFACGKGDTDFNKLQDYAEETIEARENNDEA